MTPTRSIAVSAASGSQSESPFVLHYDTIKAVTSVEDTEAKRKRYCGVTRANNVFDLSSDLNVRRFLGRDDDGQKRKSTLVNLAIRETLQTNCDLFPLLNSGLVILARKVEVDDAKRIARLKGASIINGAQTQGVLKEYFGGGSSGEVSDPNRYPSVSFELIITDDEDLIAEITIARNFQNRVADLSIYGRQGLFDSLEEAIKKHDKNAKLRKTETDFGPDYLDTEKMIQVVTAIAPQQIQFRSAAKLRAKTPETLYRVYAYRHRSRCLKDFAAVMDASEDENEDGSTDKYPPEFKAEAKKYFLDMTWPAWQLYKRLRSEQAFSRLHTVKGDVYAGKKEVAEDGVPEGIVFPILSSLSQFVADSKNQWKLEIPKGFPWNTVFNQAINIFTTGAFHNPNVMGKSATCYLSLYGLISMYLAKPE